METQKKEFQNIIVGVDFSKYSHLAVKQARQLAKQFKAKLILVYARSQWLIPEDGASYGLKDQPLFETSEMEKLMKKYYGILPASKEKICVEKGTPADIILKVAGSLSLPLIVIGSQGSGALGRYLLGSNAEKIALSSPFPVWVHKGLKVVPLNRILVPMDLSNKNQKVSEFVEQHFGSKNYLEYLFVRNYFPIGWQTKAYDHFIKLEKKNDYLLKRFQNEHPKAKVGVSFGDPARQINKAALKFDLIVMSPHNKYGSSQLFGKVTTKIIRVAQKPILIIKATKTVAKIKERQRSSDIDVLPESAAHLHS
jgi:nucleotide-binding universal stress UspA family protein